MAKRRRGNGEGSIIKRKDGRWQASATVGFDYEAGKPRRAYFYGKTRREVQEKLSEALGRVKAGKYVAPSRMTVGEWMDTWLNDYMKPSLRPTTWGSYEMQIRQHIKPALGHLRLVQLQTSHLQRLYNEKLAGGRADGKAGGLSPRSVRYIHTVIHIALEQALKEQHITINPANVVKLPRVTKKEMNTLDIEGISKFLEAARDTRHYAAYLLELATGLRRGELLGLRWQDVDLKAGTLRVTQQYVRTNDGNIFQAPKTNLSRRTVQIPQNVVKEIRAHKAWQAQYRLALGEAYENNDLVFCNEDGRPLDPRSFTRHFGRVLARAGLPKMCFHDLRHTFATLSLQEGVSARAIQEALGHHTAAFTMTTYSHVTDRMKQDASDKIGNLLQAATRQ